MDDIVKRIRQQSYFGLEPYEAANEIEQLRQRVQELEKQRDELLADLAEAKRSAEFNFEQYQDVGRLLHEECEKTEKLLAAMIHIQQVACSGSPELGIATDAIARAKGEQ